MKYEQTPVTTKLTRKSVMKLTNDISKLPTHEILRRLYKRHSVGLWELACVLTWTVVIWNKLG